MPRQPRIQFEDAAYHVMQRGVDKQLIVRDDQDRLMLIGLLAKTVIEYRWSLTAYCLMDNHLHALIRTRKPNLAVGMKLLQQTYVRRFNDRHGRVGPLFQGRYKAKLLTRNDHHIATLRYIPLNPVAHGACAHPTEWHWSSYRATIRPAIAPDFLDAEAVAELFDDGAEGYRRFVEFGIPDALERARTRPPLAVLLTRPDGIHAAHKHGYSLRQIGDAVGLHHSAIARIIRRAA